MDSEDGTYTVKNRCYPKSAVRHNTGNAKISKSVILPTRLPTDSQKIALILSLINFSKAARSRYSAKCGLISCMCGIEHIGNIPEEPKLALTAS